MKITGTNTNIKIPANTNNTKQDRRVTNKPPTQPTQPTTTITKPNNNNNNNNNNTNSRISDNIKNSIDIPTSASKQEQYSSNNRIQVYLRTISQLEEKISKLQSQLQYCHSVQAWLHSVINPNYPNTTSLKSLMSASSKLNIIQKQAIFATNKPSNNNNNNNDNNNKCSISQHLTYLLSNKTNKKQKIAHLLKTRQELYTKIQQSLIKQEPYLHEKMMKKIRKQVRKQTKLQAIEQLKKIIKQKQSWLSTTKKQIEDKIDDKLIEQKVSNNLQKMKQIMNKKILNNDYVCEVTSNQAINRSVQRFRKKCKQATSLIKAQLAKMKDNVEEELQELQRVKLMKRNHVQLDEGVVEEINELIKEGQSYLVEPLGSDGTPYLHEQYERLQNQINRLANENY